MAFVHLDCYSDYSIGESVVRVSQIVQHALGDSCPVIGLADPNVLFGSIQFYSQAHQNKVKPLVGMAVKLEWGEQHHQRLLLYAQNSVGYKNLIGLSTSINMAEETRNSHKLVTRKTFEDYQSGLLVICDGIDSYLGEVLVAGRLDDAAKLVEYFTTLLGDRIYFSLQRVGHPDERAFASSLIQLARLYKLVLVATNPVRFANKKDLELVEIRYAIEYSQTFEKIHSSKIFYPGQYLRSNQEMQELFADMPQLIANGEQIARRCNLEIITGQPLLPSFGDSSEDLLQQLHQLSTDGLKQHLEFKAGLSDEQQSSYFQRLESELGVIESKGFVSYFLMVHEFIQWAVDNDISVGPGRGSAAGSLVSWCLGITQLDPIAEGLVFERFLNPERKSMPDIDIDFCIRNRDRVYQHVVQKYGENLVSQIITFGKLRPKAAIRDVARVLGYPYAVGNSISGYVPQRPEMTFALAFDESTELTEKYKEDKDTKRIVDLAIELEGVVRNIGKHAAGVVIAPSEITQYAPLYMNKAQALVTQFAKDDLDMIGLVKFDFLGLDTLTIIDQALTMIERLYGKKIDFKQIPMDDLSTYKLLQRGDSIGVFQVESDGMRKHLRNLIPNGFEDIVAILALYRPGPMAFIEDFIDRKHGRKTIEYPHPSLNAILDNTYGIAVYQEQVMLIAQELSGYSLGEADNLRRAMGKKDQDIMEAESDIFVKRAVDRGASKAQAEDVFAFIKKFADYGFNKSHAAVYAVLTFRTAWIKAHYPQVFFASMLSSQWSNVAKANALYRDCRKHGITLLGPHINSSNSYFEVTYKKEISFGLLSIKQVGEQLTIDLVAERQLGEFAGLFDFVQRMNHTHISKQALEGLICAGAFDGLGMTRAELFANIAQALHLAEQLRNNHRLGTGDLFGGIDNKQLVATSQLKASVWTDKETLERERVAIGMYLSGHPFEASRKQFSNLITHTLQQISSVKGKKNEKRDIRVAGAIIDLRERSTKTGREKLFTLEDGADLLEIQIKESNPSYDKIIESEAMLFICKLKYDPFFDELRLNIDKGFTLLEASCAFATSVRISFKRGITTRGSITKLRSFLANHLGPQGVRVYAELYKEGVITEVAMGEQWRIRPSEDMLQQFSEQCPFARLKLEYH